MSIAWFILYWIVNNSASVVITLITLCIVLTIGLLKGWMWEINVVTWFLILASDTTIVKEGLDDVLSTMSSNFSIYFLTLEEQGWKEKQSENKSRRQFPG